MKTNKAIITETQSITKNKNRKNKDKNKMTAINTHFKIINKNYTHTGSQFVAIAGLELTM